MRGAQRRESYPRPGVDPSKDFDSLTLSSGSVSAASSLPPSRFATPRTAPLGLPPDGDGGGGIEDRRQVSNEREMPGKLDSLDRLRGAAHMDVDGDA